MHDLIKKIIYNFLKIFFFDNIIKFNYKYNRKNILKNIESFKFLKALSSKIVIKI